MRIPVRAIIGSTIFAVALAVGAATASAADISTSHGTHPDHAVPHLVVAAPVVAARQARPVVHPVVTTTAATAAAAPVVQVPATTTVAPVTTTTVDPLAGQGGSCRVVNGQPQGFCLP